MTLNNNGRFESLDILRGLDMMLILGWGGCFFPSLLGLCGIHDGVLVDQFKHVPWIGLHLYDLVFPTFLFISGVTWPFSYAKQLERGDSSLTIYLRILKRALLLVILGAIFERVFEFNWENFRVWSVIGRIGIAWAIGAVIYRLCPMRARIVLSVLLLLGWWAFCRFTCAPGTPPDINPILHPEYLLSRWIDINYLTTAHRGEGGVTTLAMIVTVLFGQFLGEYLRAARSSGNRQALTLFITGALAIGLGLVIAFCFGDYSFPVIKNLWSSSFALVAGGIATMALAVVFWLVDVKGYRTWGFFWKVIGMNAILIYLGQGTILPWGTMKSLFFKGTMDYLRANGQPDLATFIGQFGTLLLFWCILYYLYRRKIFLRV